jgi:hypothetical protein
MHFGFAEFFFPFFGLAYLAIVVYVLVLGTRLVKAVEKIADRS